MTDAVIPIQSGYVFSDSGRNGKAINYRERKNWYVGVIGARVDAYVVDGVKIIVARRPTRVVMNNGMADVRLLSICEYWTIDTDTRVIEQIADASKWPGVQCDMGKTYGAIVENRQ